MRSQVETVIVGGGQAGLAMSHYLGQSGREHVILERRRLAERWRSERWDSLYFQFPNWSLQLPGQAYDGPDPDRFATSPEVIRFIERYAAHIRAPLQCGVEVRRVHQDAGTRRFIVETNEQTFEAAHVVLATGPFQSPRIPASSRALPADILQLHASHYLNPAQLPPGAVLIVGTGSSGCQIAEDLYRSGRTVYLSVSTHKRAPRRYRGEDLLYWLDVLGRFDTPIDAFPGRKIPPPMLMTGVDGGHDVDLRRFAAEGVVLLGRFRDARDTSVAFEDNVEQVLAQADQSFEEFMRCAEDYALATGMDEKTRIEERPERLGSAAPHESPRVIDARASGINAVIWCTGYGFDFKWVDLPVFDARGTPVQRRGVTRCKGTYFLGLHWMHTMRSGVLFGVGQDAAFLAEHIAGAVARR